MIRCWDRSDVDLNQLWEKGDRVYRVVGIADDPTVILQDISTGDREHHVICSLNFSKYVKLGRFTKEGVV
jgi:hypothetical protein